MLLIADIIQNSHRGGYVSNEDAAYYDPGTHKLHWAKELEFDGSPQHTLNYDVRVLGRKGRVLEVYRALFPGKIPELKCLGTVYVKVSRW